MSSLERYGLISAISGLLLIFVPSIFFAGEEGASTAIWFLIIGIIYEAKE